MLSMAVEDGHLQGNPASGSRFPKGTGKGVQLTWEHVVAPADAITPRYRILLWFGALQGLTAGPCRTRICAQVAYAGDSPLHRLAHRALSSRHPASLLSRHQDRVTHPLHKRAGTPGKPKVETLRILARKRP